MNVTRNNRQFQEGNNSNNNSKVLNTKQNGNGVYNNYSFVGKPGVFRSSTPVKKINKNKNYNIDEKNNSMTKYSDSKTNTNSTSLPNIINSTNPSNNTNKPEKGRKSKEDSFNISINNSHLDQNESKYKANIKHIIQYHNTVNNSNYSQKYSQKHTLDDKFRKKIKVINQNQNKTSKQNNNVNINVNNVNINLNNASPNKVSENRYEKNISNSPMKQVVDERKFSIIDIPSSIPLFGTDKKGKKINI
jgi:hypothetical protein